MTENKSVFREITRNMLRGSFMGAADPVTMEKSARAAAAKMKLEGVNTVFLIPI